MACFAAPLFQLENSQLKDSSSFELADHETRGRSASYDGSSLPESCELGEFTDATSAVQDSERYQATVVPLANIMDIGFVVMTPIIVSIAGIDAPLTMLGLYLVGYAMGWVMRYNIRRFEPVSGERGLLHGMSIAGRWALVVASLVNVAYYMQVMGAAILFPFDLSNTATVETIIAVGTLVILGLVGYFFGLKKLNDIGGRTTAFNLAAVSAVVVGFLTYNIVVAVQGDWSLPDYNPPETAQGLRQILGFFALAQGFEASRYLTAQYGAELRISTMRTAQIIATMAAVLFPASALLLFAEVTPKADPAAIAQIAVVASPVLLWLVVLLAIGSEASATINALASRSDVLVQVSNRRIARQYTFPLLAAGSILIVLVTDVLSAVAAASRVFAVYYVLQCVIAIVLARRHEQWRSATAIALVGLAMVAVAVFGLSS